MEESDNSQESPLPAENMATIKEVFMECQETNKSEKFVLALEKLYEESDELEFFEEFRNLLLHVLVHVGAETPVNRISKIVIGFMLRLDKEHTKAMEEDEDDASLHPFIENMLNFLLEMEDAACYSVRLRALHLMAVLFKELDELPSDGAFWDSLSEMASSRLRDTSACVRAKAVLTFCYLQDPSSNSCPIITDFLLLMNKDPNHIVRRNIANSIAVTSKTLIGLKTRLQDINSSVRKTALLRISEKVSINCFTVVQRMEILTICINDVSNDVRLIGKQRLLPTWLKMCDNDIMKFLDLVDIQSIPDIMQKVLNVLFEIRDVRNIAKTVDINPESYLMSADQLTIPQAFLWRCLCQYVKTMNSSYASDFFDDLTPTLSALCAYLEEYFKTMDSSKDKKDIVNRCFIFQQILSIAAELDFSDTYGERTLHALILDILKSEMCILEMIKPLILCLKCMEGNHQRFLQKIYDIVQEIHKPLLIEDIDVKNPANFITMRKVLLILIEAWKFPKINQVRLEMDEIKDNVIMPVLTHENRQIRRSAVEALGLYSMYSVEEARVNYSRFMEAIIYGQLDVQIIALKVSFDIIIIFGYQLISELEKVKANVSGLLFWDPNAPKQQLALFVEKLMPLLDSEAPEIVYVAAEGLAKVMICHRITSATLFFKLCTMRYNIANEDDEKLKFCIGTFMSAYAESKALTTSCLKETFSKALELTIDAPAGSDLSKVDGVYFLRTLIQLAHIIPTIKIDSEGITIHTDLALMLCNKILEDPEADSVSSLVEIFSIFVITPPVPDELIDAVERMQNEIESKKLLNIVNNFLIKLREPMSDDEEEKPLAPRQLSFSQNSAENSSGTETTTDIPSSQDAKNDSQLSLKILVDDSSSASEVDIETDSDLANSPPKKICSEQYKVDMYEEIVIPESPECEQGINYVSESAKYELEKNCKPEDQQKTSHVSKSAEKRFDKGCKLEQKKKNLECDSDLAQRKQKANCKSHLTDSSLEKSRVSKSEESQHDKNFKSKFIKIKRNESYVSESGESQHDESCTSESGVSQHDESCMSESEVSQHDESCISESEVSQIEESYIYESGENRLELSRELGSSAFNRSKNCKSESAKKEFQSVSPVKKGYVGDQLEKSCDDDVFLSSDVEM